MCNAIKKTKESICFYLNWNRVFADLDMDDIISSLVALSTAQPCIFLIGSETCR